MSMILMAKAMQTKVGNPLRKLVLIKLADNANDKGECWPSYQHIADQCEISKRSVINHIEALQESGLLVKEIRKGGEKGNKSNVYHLRLDVVQEIHQGGAGDSPGVVQEIHQGGAGDSLPPSAGAAPRTSHSLEPVIEPKTHIADSDGIRAKKPACPINQILDLWAEIMPEKRQPVRSIWKQGQNGANLSNRWKQCFTLQHSQENRTLYHDLDSGLVFWRKLFEHLRSSEFLMRDDSRFFGLDWIVKKGNFEKILEGKYHA